MNFISANSGFIAGNMAGLFSFRFGNLASHFCAHREGREQSDIDSLAFQAYVNGTFFHRVNGGDMFNEGFKCGLVFSSTIISSLQGSVRRASIDKQVLATFCGCAAAATLSFVHPVLGLVSGGVTSYLVSAVI